MMKLTKGLILTFVLAGSIQTSKALEEDNCDIVCTQNYSPVCGSNGVTYSNECLLNVEACLTKSVITVSSQGECTAPSNDAAPCPDVCPFNYQPVCGTDGVTYGNECLLSVEACKTKSQIIVASQGECVKQEEEKETPCVDMCPQVYQPVCGSDGHTYGNPCSLAQYACKTKSQVTVAYSGECTDACEVICTKEYVPVCGSDQITYPNLCELQVSACRSKMQITVSHNGECEKQDISVETPCPGFCTMEYNPVCGSDKKTYGNLCLLNSEACRLKTTISLIHQGECTKEDLESEEECPEMCTMIYQPVCGSNWVTYGNECLLRHSACLTKSQISVAHSVACEDVGCAMKCSSAPNPVCGSDGVTYLNQCMMLKASCEQKAVITLERQGICNTECNEMCPKIYRPVCGSDGITYSNQCVLEATTCKSLQKGNGLITKYFDGPCENDYSAHAQTNSRSLSVGLGIGFGVLAVAAMAIGVVMYNKKSTSDPAEKSTLINRADSA